MVEPLGILVLPCGLDGYELEAHARALLEIPRVLALEPRREGISPLISEAASMGQAKRLRLPGKPRLVVLYGPDQYPLARAIVQRNVGAELWYLDAGPPREAGRITDFDHLARRDAKRVIAPDKPDDMETLRARLTELEVINPRPFGPKRRAPRAGKARFGFR
jgi:hypothetical protein